MCEMKPLFLPFIILALITGSIRAQTPTPTPTTTPTPTATPFGGVLGITTPGTGAGSTSSLSWLGILLILLGTALVALARLPRSDGIRIEDV